MANQNLLRGLFLTAVALAFGLGSLRYTIGSFGKPGPGLFPLLVSSVLLVVGVLCTIEARLTAPVAMKFPLKSFLLILLSIAGFAAISHFVNMMAGIVFTVFCSSLAGSDYSVKRNLAISAVLVGVAFALHMLLGLQLPIL